MTLARTPLKRAKPLARGESKLRRTPLKRGAPMKRTRMRRGPRSDKRTPYENALAAFVRTLPCVVCGDAGPWARIEASHVATSADQKGTGMKVPHTQVVPKCRFHHVQWEERRGVFAGWSKEKRYEMAATWLRELQLAITPEDYTGALELERWGLGRVVGEADAWHWLPLAGEP